MTVKLLTSGLVIRWLSFRDHAEQIMRLRRRIYTEEQGYTEDKTVSSRDEQGLHLAAIYQGELIAMISAYVYDDEPEALAPFHLADQRGRVVQYSKRIELAEFRAHRISEYLASIMGRLVHETLCPDCTFIVLAPGPHARLQSHYAKVYGFEYHATMAESDSLVMTTVGRAALCAVYCRLRKMCDASSERLGVRPPSLVRYLETVGRLDLVAIEKLTNQNLYTAPLSFQDELPRLSAQTRLLLYEQKSRIASVDFPAAPARLLDAGAGPGVYLSRLAKESKFLGYDLVGLDLSAEMVVYARLNRPDVRWINANIYMTGEPDQSYDVVHANFLFIHLLNPAFALREIHRILKPGGIFYVLDVNDSTFQGPQVLSHLIELHTDLCEGNRSVLNTLPDIAKEHGFTLVHSFSTRARNIAPENELGFSDDELHLDRRTSWGLLSFIGQREELAEQFKAAQEYYFASKCEISMCIQTHVYRKTD
jgi:SAM-dependent methyltransferase